jgi:c-di-GMP-binding flagellar brake protein YcgR
MSEEKRKFKRATTDIAVQFNEEKVDKATKTYLQGVASNCGLGGMFLVTRHLFSKGSIVNLKFFFKDGDEEVYIEARAIVRRVQRFRSPRGMGLEFFEFSGFGEKNLEQYISRILKR